MTKVEKIFGRTQPNTKYEGFMFCKASHVDGYVRGHLSAAFESLQEIEAFRHVLKAFSHRSQREGSECVVFFAAPLYEYAHSM